MELSERRRAREVRFVPADGRSLFSIRAPFRAVLQRTGDPHIIKIRLLGHLPEVDAAPAHSADPSAGALAVVDRVAFNVIEAVTLLLDAGGARQREATIQVVHHALKQLVRIRKDAAAEPAAARRELAAILEDLRNLGVIAEDEIRHPAQ